MLEKIFVNFLVQPFLLHTEMLRWRKKRESTQGDLMSQWQGQAELRSPDPRHSLQSSQNDFPVGAKRMRTHL